MTAAPDAAVIPPPTGGKNATRSFPLRTVSQFAPTPSTMISFTSSAGSPRGLSEFQNGRSRFDLGGYARARDRSRKRIDEGLRTE